MIHQHRYAKHTDDQGERKANRQSLRSQEDDFQQRNENWNRRQYHRRNSGGHVLLGPKYAAIIDNENQRSEKGGAYPLPAAGSGRAFKAHPAIQCEAGYEKTNSREKKRRDFVDSYP